MTEDEEKDPKISESKGTNLNLILARVGILLILMAIVIIILIIFNKDRQEAKENKKTNNWEDSYKKADEFISKLNLTERIGLLYGTKNMKYEIGMDKGEANKEKGINTVSSPSVYIMRTPQVGRTWEGFGEDSHYSGVCAAEIIKGIQDYGVIATLKHFVGNDQETYRHSSSSNIEINVLMDIYIEPFYRPIHEAKVGAVMAAFNALNNTYCSENKYFLTDILRRILDFKGFDLSDWWSVYSSHSDTFKFGLDINMYF